MIKQATKPAKPKTILLLVYGDAHPNSLVGLCPPVVVRDNGSEHHYSDAQRWLWENWIDTWETVKAWKKALRAELWIVINGDGTDDNKHSHHGLITVNKSVIIDLSIDVHQVAAKLADKVFYVRGTEAHGGGAGELEEQIAQELGCIPDDETGNRSWWHLPLVANGVSFDIAHHPPSNSTRPWTKGGGAERTAAIMCYEYAEDGHRPPDVVIRSHVHHFEDSGTDRTARCFFTPPWQLCTAFGHRVGYSGRIEPVGVLGYVCRGEPHVYEFRKLIHKPERRKPWETAKTTRSPKAN